MGVILNNKQIMSSSNVYKAAHDYRAEKLREMIESIKYNNTIKVVIDYLNRKEPEIVTCDICPGMAKFYTTCQQETDKIIKDFRVADETVRELALMEHELE